MSESRQRHTSATLYPRRKDPVIHCTGGWVGLRAALDTEARGKIHSICRGSNPVHPVYVQTLYWLSYPPTQSRAVPLHATQCQGGRDIAATHFLPGTKWGEWSASRYDRSLPPGKGFIFI
jgi:hypothetical protein